MAKQTWLDERGIASASTKGMRPFYAGAMHYWRVDPVRWAPCLRAMHDLGFTLVETPIPWRIHEPARGQFGWTGERDLARFVETARAAELGVVLRAGPTAGAELTSFGIPDWVLAEPACRAVTSRGTPAWLPALPRAFPIPSYASAAFRAHVRAWFDAVAKIALPYLGDPVVAIGIERGRFFRTGAYDVDYHPDALAWFGHDAPRAWDPANAAACARWVQFQDDYASRALAELSAMLDDVGLGDVARIELPPATYAPRATLREVRAGAIANAGIGLPPWLPPGDDDPTAERDRLLALLASGARGFDLTMAVERDRYYGAAIDRAGRVQATWLKPLLAALAAIDWPGLRRATPIAVLDLQADRRFGIASCLVDPMTPILGDVLGLGPGGAAELGSDAGAIAARRWHTAVCRALELAQIPYAIVDEHAAADELAGYRAVIAPTLDRVDRAAWETLRQLAEAKRTVVVIGPGTPTRDELDQPLDDDPSRLRLASRRMGRLEPGSLDDHAGLAAALAALAGELPEAWHVERPEADRSSAHPQRSDAPPLRPRAPLAGPSSVRTAVYSDAAGVARIVFVLADTNRPVSATLVADARFTQMRDALTDECIPVHDGRVTITLAGARVLCPEP